MQDSIGLNKFREAPDNVMDPVFKEVFCNTPIRERNELWIMYMAWEKMNSSNIKKMIYEEFAKSLQNSRKEAEEKLAQWTCPVKNGKKGQDYTCEFTLPEDLSFMYMEGLEAAGLRSQKINNKIFITGKPESPGDFNVSIVCVWRGLNKLVYEAKKRVPSLPLDYWRGQFIRKIFTISIMPDPKDLWKNIPTPSFIEYYKTDQDAAIMECGDNVLLGASVRGRSHAHTGLPRDDDFAIRCAPLGWSIMIVADGAGSARFSRMGSAIACQKAMETCINNLPSDEAIYECLGMRDQGKSLQEWMGQLKKIAYNILPRAAHTAKNAIKQEAQAKERAPRDYATTLLLAMIKKFGTFWVVFSFQVGDGAMGILTANEGKLLIEPDEGEFGGQTRFITMEEIFNSGDELMARTRVDVVQDLENVILMSDGVSDAWFMTLQNLRGSELWLSLRDDIDKSLRGKEMQTELTAALMEWLQFWSQGNHDDRTLTMWRRVS